MSNLRWLVKQDGTRVLQKTERASNEQCTGLRWVDAPSIPEVKEEVKPREFWISPYDNETMCGLYVFDKPNSECIRAVELPNGSRVLSRREVIHAIEAVINLSQHQIDLISNNLGFEVYK